MHFSSIVSAVGFAAAEKIHQDFHSKGTAMEIENKFKKFDLTAEMVEHFRSLAAVTKKSDEYGHGYAITTIVLGEHEASSTEQGDNNAELG